MTIASFDERINIFDEKYFQTKILQKVTNIAFDFTNNPTSI